MRPESMDPSGARPRRSLPELIAMKQRGERIVMVTVYDAPSARLADAAGIDIALVGDSAAMTVLGHDSTLPITVNEMLMLTRAVARGASRALVVADLPFGSYQASDEIAVQNAIRFLKEGGADAVKLEGAGPTVRRIGALLEAGIPVMGHIGLTPQSIKRLGSYKPQGRTAPAAHRLLEEARALERVGCFSIVLEAIPAPVAAHITAAVSIPTIGIGSGVDCDGQVLVWHDVLGLSSGHLPRFVRQYANLDPIIVEALTKYAGDVRAGRFPEARHTYGIPDAELERFEKSLTPAGVADDE